MSNLEKIYDKKSVLKEFMVIPGVGKSIAGDLWDMGYRSLIDLKNEDPEAMYNRFCEMVGMHVDRCLLYVFRCAVYFVSCNNHDPELLKWWNWKNKSI